MDKTPTNLTKAGTRLEIATSTADEAAKRLETISQRLSYVLDSLRGNTSAQDSPRDSPSVIGKLGELDDALERVYRQIGLISAYIDELNVLI